MMLLSVKRKSRAGFTLIELSIVLVIIGLIVGGILTGQDLIKAAEQRATLAQIEKYNTAVNTFRNKFTGVPGDLSTLAVSNFGMPAITTNAGATGYGDGNGLIEGSASGSAAFIGEPPLFWQQLSMAGLIDGSFGGTTLASAAGDISTAGAITAATTVTAVNAYMPPAKLGRSNSITVASTSGMNYFIIAGITNIAASGIYSSGANNLTPLESYNMDKKVDDGYPVTGSVAALDNATNQIATAATSAGNKIGTVSALATCVNTSTPVGYSVSGAGGNSPGCSLRFRFN